MSILDDVADNPAIGPLYAGLVQALKPVGAITVEHQKTSIHVRSKGVFLGIHPRKEYLLLQIVGDAPLVSQRVVKTDQVSAKRFHNHVRLSAPGDIDAELVGWLAKAHALMA